MDAVERDLTATEEVGYRMSTWQVIKPFKRRTHRTGVRFGPGALVSLLAVTLTLGALPFAGSATAAPAAAMVLTVDTMANSCSGTTVTLPLSGTVDVTVNWGDNSSDTVVAPGNLDHSYASGGQYQITISGTLSWFGSQSDQEAPTDCALTGVTAWGELGITSFRNAFANDQNLTTVPSSLPTQVTDLSDMFNGAWQFNQDIGAWDTSKVTDMSGMFDDDYDFNQNISAWNTSSVTDMNNMFYSDLAFNQNISAWDTSKVTDMGGMLNGAIAFNNDGESLATVDGGWDTSSVTDMSDMFDGDSLFNSDIGSWDTSKVTDMNSMFYGDWQFNADLSAWDTSNVTDMSNMFNSALQFNQDISDWDTSKVTDMSCMFEFAGSFNESLGHWSIGAVQDMGAMFDSTSLDTANYDSTLESWASQSVSSDVVLGASNTTYGSEAVAARTKLIDSFGWTIYDNGLEPGATDVTDTVTFNAESGSAVDSVSGYDGSTITLPDGPTRSGYTFAGWYAASSGGTVLTSPYTLTGSVTLYAQWIASDSILSCSITPASVQLAEGDSRSLTVTWTGGSTMWVVILINGEVVDGGDGSLDSATLDLSWSEYEDFVGSSGGAVEMDLYAWDDSGPVGSRLCTFSVNVAAQTVGPASYSGGAWITDNTSADRYSVGDTLRADPGTWTSDTGEFTYQWMDCPSSFGGGANMAHVFGCTEIIGATSSTYTLTRDDEGYLIAVAVTDGGTDSSTTTVIDYAGTPVSTIPASSTSVVPVAQSPLHLTSLVGTVGTGLTLSFTGGSGTGALATSVVNGSATGCAVTGGVITAATTGTCVVTLTKAGDQVYSSVSSAATAVVFWQTPQALLRLTSLTGTVGTGLKLAVRGGSGTGAVSFAVTGGTASGCSITRGVLSVKSAGTCLVATTNAGDATFSPLTTSATVTFRPAPARHVVKRVTTHTSAR